MPEMMRVAYGTTTPEIDAALDQRLLAHRDLVYERHIGLPLDF